MPLALLALTIGAFAIGTTEFVIVGLVPTIAEQLAISLPSAGLLVFYLRARRGDWRPGAHRADRAYAT
ncbi:drug efflux protein [Klebsiella michiganensis]|uniref:Drug efflux protein n=1 Tax=Klebsiella michiganensis TaxID=1134687 RepID=A0A7H4LZH8_9ENTR|nr:drug efflux protein [Klebsiella michiganensis]